jgi:hypothetical protein
VPTHDEEPGFWADFNRLSPEKKRQFRRAAQEFGVALTSRRFPPSLRVKRVHGHPGTWEMTWAPDGRATFEYGPEVRPGAPHIIWRRIGSHEILDRP